jgi:hypothetical protein
MEKTNQEYDREYAEYLKEKQFYERMLNGELNNTENREKLQKQQTIKTQKTMQQQEEEGKQEITHHRREEEEVKEGCTQCQSASFIDTKVRLKKKENPCLLEPNEIK